MAIFFIDSFSHYATADIFKKWTTRFNDVAIAPGYAVVAGEGRCLQNALRVSNNGTISGSGPCLVFSPITEICAGVGFKKSNNNGRHCVFRFSSNGLFGSSSRQVEVCVEATMNVTINGRGVGTDASLTKIEQSADALNMDSWHFIELTYSFVTNEYAVYVDEDLWLSGTHDFDSEGTGSANVLMLGCGYNNSSSAFFSDLYLGSAVADRKGDSRVFARLPNNDGTFAEWTPSVGTRHYLNVDEASINTTDYNSTGTVGQRDTYAFPAVGIPSGIIHAIQINAGMKRDDVGTRRAAPITIQSGIEYQTGTARSIADGTYLFYRSINENDPLGNDWTVSTANNDEFGVKLTA